MVCCVVYDEHTGPLCFKLLAVHVKHLKSLPFPQMYLAACPTFRKDLWLQHCSCLLGLHSVAGCVSCPRVSCGSCSQSGMQGDISGRGSRRIGCWDGSPKTKLWTLLIIRGEKSTYPEPDSSCTCAHAKRRSGKTPFKCLFLS